MLSSLTWGTFWSGGDGPAGIIPPLAPPSLHSSSSSSSTSVSSSCTSSIGECGNAEEEKDGKGVTYEKDYFSTRSINKTSKDKLSAFKYSSDKLFFINVIDKINISLGIYPQYSGLSPSNPRFCINRGHSFWTGLPEGVHPKAGHIPDDRLERKVNQVENMVELCIILIEGAAAKERRREDFPSIASSFHEASSASAGASYNSRSTCDSLCDLDKKLKTLISEIQRHEITRFHDDCTGGDFDIRNMLSAVLVQVEDQLNQLDQALDKDKRRGRKILAFRNIVSSWLSEYIELTKKIESLSVVSSVASVNCDVPLLGKDKYIDNGVHSENNDNNDDNKCDDSNFSRQTSGESSGDGATSRRKLTIVEFCAGSGFVVLPLAAIYPAYEFILVDRKGPSLHIGQQRIRDAKLTNVTVIQDDIENINFPFDVGISLHACGSATDITIEKCINQNASLLCCSCCIGKIVKARSTFISKSMAESLSETDFKHIVRAADFGHGDVELYSESDIMRRICKSYVELDRQLHLRESGYESRLVLMAPKSASPKNDMIVAWPVSDIVDVDESRRSSSSSSSSSRNNSDNSDDSLVSCADGYTLQSRFDILTQSSNESLKTYLF